MHPLIEERLNRRRSIFGPHQKLRMNIVPMFLNIFVPWGVFVFCLGVTSFWMMYAHPTLVWTLIGLVGATWMVLVFAAVWARANDPDPTWFTHFALAVGVAALVGTSFGNKNFEVYTRPYYAVNDMKVAKDVDASTMPGNNVIDAGIIHFREGTQFNSALSWHFKRGSLYCVAPIYSNTSMTPLSQTYDFWAVGKDCCSLSASDFRCGSWGNMGSKGGIRVVDEGEAAMYRLAVQQAESLYDIMAPRPILLEWSTNPEMVVDSWNQQVFKNYLTTVACAFVVSLLSTAMHTCRFSWLGRGESVYETDFYGDIDWQRGGLYKPVDYTPRTFYTA